MFIYRIKKYLAFTLAELMVIMAVMTVILAALAPIFTSRYTNVAFDSVWSYIGANDEMNDIYTDAPMRSMIQQVFIGITPTDLEDVRATFKPYSKVIIRSSHQIDGSKKQKQIQFKYNETDYGYLYAANRNILLGGDYNDLAFTYNAPFSPATEKLPLQVVVLDSTDDAHENTALGRGALNALTTGSYNAAFGYKALNHLTTGNYNTAVGVSAGEELRSGDGNVLVGYNSYNSESGEYNTIIGNNNSSSGTSDYSTAIGNGIKINGNYNVAIGYGSSAMGSFNTAVGYKALSNDDVNSSDSINNFQYNTAIGYNSCRGIGLGSKNLTCIGGVGSDSNMSDIAKSFYNDGNSRVLIGRGVDINNSRTAATLEVHNLTSNNSKFPYPGSTTSAGIGDSSVIVNGNLIVRGQTYMTGRSIFPIAPYSNESTVYTNYKMSLMGYRLYREATATEHKPLIGYDGSEYTMRLQDEGKTGKPFREAYTGMEHCICSYSCSENSLNSAYDWSKLNFDSYSYVTNSFYAGNNDYLWGASNHSCGNTYNISSTNNLVNVELSRARNIIELDKLLGGSTREDIIKAMSGSGSCCPILNSGGVRKVFGDVDDDEEFSSDLRLKNIISPFKNSVDLLSRLKIYNYNFKSDKNKSPFVGVIAQDLKAIFPNSVSKDEKGYYRIRWDEMFYTAINSVKELNSKILALADRIQTDISRIITLKKENNMLRKKLFELSNELDLLENK